MNKKIKVLNFNFHKIGFFSVLERYESNLNILRPYALEIATTVLQALQIGTITTSKLPRIFFKGHMKSFQTISYGLK